MSPTAERTDIKDRAQEGPLTSPSMGMSVAILMVKKPAELVLPEAPARALHFGHELERWCGWLDEEERRPLWFGWRRWTARKRTPRIPVKSLWGKGSFDWELNHDCPKMRAWESGIGEIREIPTLILVPTNIQSRVQIIRKSDWPSLLSRTPTRGESIHHLHGVRRMNLKQKSSLHYTL